MRIPLSSPDITDDERRAVREVLDTPCLALGPRLAEFEEKFAAVTHSRHAVAVNSGTSALHLCMKAAGIRPGDRVVTTPFSFVASANCILYEQGIPVFVDIDPETHNLDAAQVEAAAARAAAKAVLPVHVFGRPCDMDPILATARRHGLTVIEDACEAAGASYRGKPAGSFGQTGAFAFYPNKQITTGEGGMLVTDDAEVARLCRSWRNQGRGEGGGWLEHERLGYNYRLPEISCALGLAQLSRLGEILARRAVAAALYSEMLADIEPLLVPAPPRPDTEMSWFVYVVRLRDEFSRRDRDGILESLRAQGVGCNNYFTPIHLQPFYRERFGYRPGDFPVTERIAERTIALPFFTGIREEQMDAVRQALLAAVSRLSSPLMALAQALEYKPETMPCPI